MREADFQNITLVCGDCGREFVWSAGAQEFFRDKGLANRPKRCKSCKARKKEEFAAREAAAAIGERRRVEVTVNCAECGAQTTVPFFPSQGRPVLCWSCHHEKNGPQIREVREDGETGRA